MEFELTTFFKRAFGLLFTTKKTWIVIRKGSASGTSIFLTYALPLLLVSGFADFIFQLNKGTTVETEYSIAVIALIFSIIGDSLSIFMAAYLISLLAGNYGINASFQLHLKIISYSITAFAIVSALVKFVPVINVAYILAFYSFYIYYAGLSVHFKFPKDKKASFVMVSILVIVVAFTVIGVAVNMVASAWLSKV